LTLHPTLHFPKMADLGALNLILGADLSPLEASLGRAESLVNQASDRMGRSFKPFKFKVEVGDLAVQLTQAEGVVDRSIRQVRSMVRQPIKFKVETGDLGVQLTEAEALVDRTVRNIKSMNRSIDLNINVRGLDDSESMVARSIQQLQGLTGQVLTIQVDDTRLTELNRHLDSKQAHYKRVHSDFATPLKVLVDDSQLTALNQHLTATQRHLTSAIAQFSGNKITPAIDLTNLNLLDRRLDNLEARDGDIALNYNRSTLAEVNRFLDRLDGTHKLNLDLPSTLGGLAKEVGKLALSPITIPIKIAQTALRDTFQGVFNELGKGLARGSGLANLGANIGRGTTQAVKSVDEHLVGSRNVSAAFIADLLDGGSLKSATKAGTDRLKGTQHMAAFKKMAALANLGENFDAAANIPELQAIIDALPAEKRQKAKEQGLDKYLARDKITKIAIAKRAQELIHEVRPAALIDNFINPALQGMTPALDYIDLIQAHGTVQSAKKQVTANPNRLPSLVPGQNGYLQTIGGAMFREGKGHGLIAGAFEGTIPDRRMIGVANPDTDPGGKAQSPISKLLLNTIDKFAPGLREDQSIGNTMVNAVTILGQSLDPTFRSKAAIEGTANILAANQQRQQIGTMTYSLGGKDGKRIARASEVMGIQSPVAALAYPDLNPGSTTQPNFQSYVADEDPLGFVKNVLGIGGKQNIQGIKLGVTPSADVHAYHHLFKSGDFRQSLTNQLGIKPTIQNPKQEASFLKLGANFYEQLAGVLQSESLMKKEDFDNSVPFPKGVGSATEAFKKSLEAEFRLETARNDDSYTPNQRAVMSQLHSRAVGVRKKFVPGLIKGGANIDPNITAKDLYGYQVYQAELGTYNDSIDTLYNGKTGDKKGYFAGELDPTTVKQRLLDVKKMRVYFNKEVDSKSPYAAKLAELANNLETVMKEFSSTGKISAETKGKISQIQPDELHPRVRAILAKKASGEAPEYGSIESQDAMLEHFLGYKKTIPDIVKNDTYARNRKSLIDKSKESYAVWDEKLEPESHPKPLSNYDLFTPNSQLAARIKRNAAAKSPANLDDFINASNPWGDPEPTVGERVNKYGQKLVDRLRPNRRRKSARSAPLDPQPDPLLDADFWSDRIQSHSENFDTTYDRLSNQTEQRIRDAQKGTEAAAAKIAHKHLPSNEIVRPYLDLEHRPDTSYNPFAETQAEIARRKSTPIQNKAKEVIDTVNPWSQKNHTKHREDPFANWNPHESRKDTAKFEPDKQWFTKLDTAATSLITAAAKLKLAASHLAGVKFDDRVHQGEHASNRAHPESSALALLDPRNRAKQDLQNMSMPELLANIVRSGMTEVSKPIGQVFSTIKTGIQSGANIVPGANTILKVGGVAAPFVAGAAAMHNPVIGSAVGAIGNIAHGFSQIPIDMTASMIGDTIRHGIVDGLGSFANLFRSTPGISSFAANALSGSVPQVAPAIGNFLGNGAQSFISSGGAAVTGAIGTIATPYIVGKTTMNVAGKAINSAFPYLNPTNASRSQLAANTAQPSPQLAAATEQPRLPAVNPNTDAIDAEILDERPTRSSFGKNLRSADIRKPNEIANEVKEVQDKIRAKRESILKLLKYNSSEQVAAGLELAKSFNFDIGLTKTELEPLLGQIERAKQEIVSAAEKGGKRVRVKGNLPGYKDLEKSRQKIQAFIDSDGVQTRSVDEAVRTAQGLTPVEPPKPLKQPGVGNIFNNLIRKNMGQDSKEEGFANLEATIASLIAAAAIPLVGAPIAAPIAIGSGLIAALKKSAFAKSKLGQTRIPGLDFLDRQIKTPSKQTIWGGIAGLGIAASSFLNPGIVSSNPLSAEQQIQSQIEKASVENGPRISDKESSEYNVLLAKQQKKIQLTNLENLKIKLYDLTTSNQITYPGYDNDWVPGKKIRNIPSESPSIIHDAYNKQEEQTRKVGYKSDPLSVQEKADKERLSEKYPNISRSGFSNDYNAEQRKLYGYVQRDELQSIKKRERNDPLTVSRLKVTPESMAQLPDEYQKLEAIKLAARNQNQENKSTNTLSNRPIGSISKHSVSQSKSQLSNLNDNSSEMMLWLAAVLGGSVGAAKIIGSRNQQQETEADLPDPQLSVTSKRNKLTQSPEVIALIKQIRLKKQKIDRATEGIKFDLAQEQKEYLERQQSGNTTPSLDAEMSFVFAKSRKEINEVYGKLKPQQQKLRDLLGVGLPKADAVAKPEPPVLDNSLPESSVSNPFEKIQLSLANAQNQFGKIGRSIGDRLKSSWKTQVTAIEQRIDRFKAAVVKTNLSTLENEAGSISPSIDLNLLSARPNVGEVKSSASNAIKKHQTEPLTGTKYPSRSSKPNSNSEPSFLDFWDADKNYPTPIPPKQSLPSKYKQVPDFWLDTQHSAAPPPRKPLPSDTTQLPDFNEVTSSPKLSIFQRMGEDMDKLAIGAKLLFGTLGGITALTIGVPAMIALGKSTLDTAGNFEALQIKLQAASDSLQTGKNLYKSISAEASKRGISRSAALETGAGIAGTTFGTELEGAPSNEITSKVLQLAQYRGLSKEQTGGLTLAINQTLGRDRASAQEINQIINSGGITDARAIAARGLGYTPQQFSKVQESSTGIDSKKFVQAFLSQGVQDSLLVKDEVLDTQQAKMTKLQATMEEFQGAIGGGVNPAFKMGIDLLTSSIDLLIKGVEIGSKVLIGMAIYNIVPTGKALLELGTAMSKNAMVTSTLGMSWNTLTALAPQLLKIVGYAALFYGLGEAVSSVANQFSNAGAEFDTAANKMAEALAKLDGKKIDLGLPTKPGDVGGGGDWFKEVHLWTQRNITNPAINQANINQSQVLSGVGSTLKRLPFGSLIADRLPKLENPNSPIVAIDDRQKEAIQRNESLSNLQEQSTGVRSKIQSAIGKAGKLQQIDLELNALSTARSGLFASGNPDATKITEIQAKYKEKYQEREAVTKEISPVQAVAQENVNNWKGAKAKLDSLRDNKDKDGKVIPLISTEEYDKQSKVIAINLKDAEAAQLALNKAIKSGLDDLTPWTRQLDAIVGKFEDIGTSAAQVDRTLSQSRNTREISGKITKGNAEYLSSSDRQDSFKSQIAQTAATIKDLKFTLNSKDPNNVANVYKDYQVDDNTSATQLKIKSEQATSVGDKETLTKLAVAKEQEIKLSSLQSQLSDARAEMYRRIESENREAIAYYVGLARQVDPTDSGFDRKIANLAQSKNQFLAKLNNFGSGLADGYISAVLDIFEATKKRFEIEQADYQAKKKALESYQDRSLDNQNRVRNAYTPGETTSIESSPVQPAGSSSPDRTVRSEQTPTTSQPASQSPTPTQSNNWLNNASPQLKSQIQAAAQELLPAERNRYLNTTMSVDGKTDLGLNDFDRKLLADGERKYKTQKQAYDRAVAEGGRVYEIPLRSGTNNPEIVAAINNGTYQSPNPKSISSPIVNSQPANTPRTVPVDPAVAAANTKLAEMQSAAAGRNVVANQVKGINDFLMGGAGASKKIYDQDLAKRDLQTETARSDANLQEIVARQKAREQAIKATREVEKQTRQQEFAVRNHSPAKTIQERQKRETEDLDFNSNETRLSVTQFKQDLGYQVGNLDELLAEYRSKPNLKPEDLQEIERLTKLRGTFVAQFKKMGTLASNLEAKIAAAKQVVAKEQAYQNEKSIETTQIQAAEIQRNQIDAQRTGIGQQLKRQQFNTGLNSKDLQLEEQSTNITIENERKRAQRAITDAERNGDYNLDRTPEQAKAYVAQLRSEVDKLAAQKRTSNQQNNAEKTREFGKKVKEENQTFDVTKSQQQLTGIEIGTRRQTAFDRADAPFANDVSIDRVYQKKIAELDVETETAKKLFAKQQEKYKGDDPTSQGLLSRATTEHAESIRQIELKRSASKLEYGADTIDRQGSRNEYLYNRNKTQYSSDIGVYDAQTAQQKLLGQDTREREYNSQKSQIQTEYESQVFSALERRKKITANTAEADAERASIDKLVQTLGDLNNIKLTNLSAQFDQFNQTIGETQKATTEAFKSYLSGSSFDLKKILQSPFISLGNQLIDKTVPSLFTGLYQQPSTSSGAGSTPQTGGGFLESGFSFIKGLFGVNDKIPTEPKPTDKTPIIAPIPSTQTPKLPDSSILQSTPPPQPNPLLTEPAAAPVTIAPAPSQLEGIPSNLKKIEVPGGYIENSAISSEKLETAIPELTTAVNSLNDSLTSGSNSNTPAITSTTENPSINTSIPELPTDSPATSSPSNNIFSSISSSYAGLLGKATGTSSSVLSLGTSLFGNIGKILGFADGGIIGTGRSQVDNRLALVEDGEGILTHLGVDTLGGSAALSKINKGVKLDNVPKFASGGVKGASYSTPRPDTSTPNISPSSSSFNNVSVGVNIDNSGGNGKIETKEDGKKMGKLINNAITSALLREQRPGGLLYT
jgi:plasmid stabilization system protein ParE